MKCVSIILENFLFFLLKFLEENESYFFKGEKYDIHQNHFNAGRMKKYGDAIIGIRRVI